MIAQARFVGGTQSSTAGREVPDLELQTKLDDANIGKFLRGEVTDELKPSAEGFLVEKAQKEYPGVNGDAGLWVHLVVRSAEGKWMAEQVRLLIPVFIIP